MSLQWTLVATFLYFEVAIIFVLLLPFISPTRWQKIFRSRLVMGLASYAGIYFNVILVALVLLLLDAIREIVKYKSRLHGSNDPTHGAGIHYGPTMESSKEFRAQRNFYISGMALFLWFVFKRLLVLISYAAHLIADAQAAKSQAESATKTASALLDSKKNEEKTASAEHVNAEELQQKLKAKEEELQELHKSLKSAKADVDAMKKQSENLTNEYDNLLKEHAKLVSKIEKYEHGEESKKDN